jgi:Ca-activated chloride channel family protein
MLYNYLRIKNQSPDRILTFILLTVFFLSFPFIISAQTGNDDEDVINVESSLVILNATITNDQGEVVNNLKKENFSIFEDGVEQEVSFFETKETPFAAIVLIDTSGSMEMRVSMARSATIKFLEGIRSDDNVAIYNFDSRVSLVQDFSNLKDLTPQVFDLKSNGWTVLNDAVFQSAVELQKRPEKRKAIIVLSDGADTRSHRTSGKALKAALNANVTIYTVDMSGINTGGKRRQQNRKVLKQFADKTGGKFLSTPGGREMRDAFEQIVKDLGIQYTLGYYPINTNKDGKWREIELKIKNHNYLVRTRQGYNSPKN